MRCVFTGHVSENSRGHGRADLRVARPRPSRLHLVEGATTSAEDTEQDNHLAGIDPATLGNLPQWVDNVRRPSGPCLTTPAEATYTIS